MIEAVSAPQRTLGQVGALAMLDTDFRARLAAAPLDVLQEFGLAVPAGVTVELVTDPARVSAATDADPTLRLYVPEASDLTEEELGMVNGAVPSCAATFSTMCTVFSISSTSTASTMSCS